MFRAVARHVAMVAGLTGALATGVPTLLVWSRRDRLVYVDERLSSFLIEMMILGTLVLILQVARARTAALASWIASGVVTVLAVAGGPSLGSLFVPGAVLLALSGLLADLDRPRRLRNHLVVAILAAGIQAAVVALG
jgi:hypothetical protein